MKAKRFERGQALVLIILAIVAMFGFAALAVDFGRVYAERRRLQSAADAAALASAFAASQGQNYLTAGMNQLHLNDVADTDPARNTDKTIDAEVYNPPQSGPYAGDHQYYQVLLHSTVDQIFSQLVYQGKLMIDVEAVSRSKSASGLYEGDVLHATSPTNCKALWFTGTGDVNLYGGDAFSDSSAGVDSTCIPGVANGSGGADCGSGVQGGSGSINVHGGDINTSGPWLTNGGAGTIVAGAINQCVPPSEPPSVPTPDCTGMPSRVYDGSVNTIDPGVYPSGIVVHGSRTELTLNPGIYCMDGDLSMNGGIITGKDVFFYMRKGSVMLGGGTYVDLMAAAGAGSAAVTDSSGYNWSGMLIYMPYNNDGEVHIGGNSGSQYTGTIYAPGPRTPETQDKCIIEGTGTSLGLSSNVICYTIKIAGRATLNIHYQANQNFRQPPDIELSQ